jgi:transcriptional regulator with XRE-family HTH domain
MINLMLARKNSKLTQKQLAKKVGISNLKISRYERGETVPKADILKRIAMELNVTMEYLLEDVGKERLSS